MSIPTRVVPSGASAEAHHGSVVAHLAGCRTRSACPHADSVDWLTCAEAAIARRGDWRAAAYPPEAPIPRQRDVPPPPRPAVHGTVWGYRRGCRQPQLCPNRYRDQPTCADVRRGYARENRRARIEGIGRAIEHGTSNGYLLGCRGDDCPNGARSMSCGDARAEYRRTRRAGSNSHVLVPADEALRLVGGLRARGLSTRQISRLAGVGRTTVGALLAGRRPRLTRGLAERLAAVVADEVSDPIAADG